MRIGPREADVRAWATTAAQQERVRRGRLPSLAANWLPPEGPVRFHIEWVDGELATARCRIEPPTKRERYALLRKAGRTVTTLASAVDVPVRAARYWESQGPDDMAASEKSSQP